MVRPPRRKTEIKTITMVVPMMRLLWRGQAKEEERQGWRSGLIAVVVREDIGESIGHRSAKTGKEYLKSLSEGGTEREEREETGTMCCMLVGMRVYLFKEPGGLFSSFLWRWRFS
jgi:hypothetical protein